MHQINFFKPYFEEKKIQPKQKMMFISALVAVVLVSLFSWNIFQIRSLKSQIAEQDAFLNSISAQKTKLEIRDTQDKIKKMDTYLQTVKGLAQGLQKEDRISRQLIDKIASMVPKALSFQAFSLVDSLFTLQGTASTRTAVAELQHNLQISDLFQNVQVKTIVQDSKGNGYTFSLEGMLK